MLLAMNYHLIYAQNSICIKELFFEYFKITYILRTYYKIDKANGLVYLRTIQD